MDYGRIVYDHIHSFSNVLIKHIKDVKNDNDNTPFVEQEIYNYSDKYGTSIFEIYTEQVDYVKEQKGGQPTYIEIDGKQYILDLYEENISDPINSNRKPYTAIFVMPMQKKSAEPKQKIPSNMCFSLIYQTKDILEIKGIQITNGCVIENKNGRYVNAIKQGTILLKHIIKYAKNNGFKSIELIDGSYYTCYNTLFKKRYNIPRIHTLCNLEPWHYKNDFRYIDDENNLNVEHNKKILENLKTHNIRFDLFINLIINQIESTESISPNQILDLLERIQQFYTEKYNSPITDFFQELTYNCCDVIGMIDEDIFKMLNLRLSEAESKNKMRLVF
jgi:hypothetical protein